MALKRWWQGAYAIAAVCWLTNCSGDTNIDLFPPALGIGVGGEPELQGGSTGSSGFSGSAGTPSSGGAATAGEAGAGQFGGASGEGPCCDCNRSYYEGKQLRFRYDKFGVIVTWPEELRLGPERTFEAWIYPVTKSSHLIFNKLRGGYEDVMLRLIAQKADAYVYSPLGNARLTAAAPVELERWHHFAMVQDAESIAIYVDGTETARTPAKAPGERGGGLIFGGGRANGFDGYLADVRFSSGARYTQPFEPARDLTADESTIGLWHFDEGAGSTVCDHGQLGLHGKVDAGLNWEVGPGRP